jgi:hypothetical protein
MTYFRDLSPYQYGLHWGGVAGAQNVGWLAASHPFETEEPQERDLDLLWEHCKVAITKRGVSTGASFALIGTATATASFGTAKLCCLATQK